MAYNVVKGETEKKIEGSVSDSGDQTIVGNKTFTNPVSAPSFYDSNLEKNLEHPALTEITNDNSGCIVVSNGDGTATAFTGLTFNGDCLKASSYFGSGVGLTNLQATEIRGKLSLDNLNYGGGLIASNQQLRVNGGKGIKIEEAGISIDNVPNGGLNSSDVGVRVDPMLAPRKRAIGVNDRFLIADSSQNNTLKSATIKSLSTYIQNTLKLTRPHGASSQIQFNDRGLFGSTANLRFEIDTLSTINVALHGELRVGKNTLKGDKAILALPTDPIAADKLPPGSLSFYLDAETQRLMVKIKDAEGVTKNLGIDLLTSAEIIEEDKMQGYLLDDDTIDDELEISEDEAGISTFAEEEVDDSNSSSNENSGILGYFKNAFTKK